MGEKEILKSGNNHAGAEASTEARLDDAGLHACVLWVAHECYVHLWDCRTRCQGRSAYHVVMLFGTTYLIAVVIHL